MIKEPLLQTFSTGGAMPVDIANTIADHFSERHLLKHEFFLQEGKVASEYLFLQEGFIRAFAHDVDGKEVTTAFFGPGEMVFEVASFFQRTPSKENLQALTACSGWALSYEQLNSLFHGLPQFREFGRSVLVRGFATLKTRTLSMITETAETRYAHLIQTNPEIFNVAPLRQIASYLGVTDTSLSRIRKSFAKK